MHINLEKKKRKLEESGQSCGGEGGLHRTFTRHVIHSNLLEMHTVLTRTYCWFYMGNNNTAVKTIYFSCPTFK